MKFRELNILIVEDHPLIVEAYMSILNNITGHGKIHFTVIKGLSEVECKVFKEKILSLDLILLDIQMPSSEELKLFTGEDLGIRLKEINKDLKIMVITSLSSGYLINNLNKRLKPEAILSKQDIGYKELLDGVNKVLDGNYYFSKTIQNNMRKEYSSKLILDNVDRLIIYELSKATRTVDLPIILSMSLAGIEKRKRKLKRALNVIGKNDKELLMKAKEFGFL